MSNITAVGNLAKTPKLYENDKGHYCYARVLVTDRIYNKETEKWEDGPTVAYDVAVNGNQAVKLVETAEQSGNIRVLFSGELKITKYEGENGVSLQHRVRATDVAASFRGQTITVAKGNTPAPEEEPWAPAATYGDDTPF